MTLPEAVTIIEKQVCEYYRLSPASLNSNSRKDTIVIARHVVRYLLFLSGFSGRAIARHYGKEHTQVGRSIQTVTGYVESGCKEGQEVVELKELLNA